MSEQAIEAKRAELLGKGYHRDLVAAGIEWAKNSARGVAHHMGDTPREEESFYTQFLWCYLSQTEPYVRKMAE